MTQHKLMSGTASVAGRVKELRQRRGWSAAVLADHCQRAGMPELNRSVIANVESGRRKYVTIDEMLTLAYVLDVAPVHLLIPTDTAEGDLYAATGRSYLPLPAAREWIRGRYCPPGGDPRTYFAEVPRDEWDAPKASAEEIERRGQEIAAARGISEQLLPPKRGRSRGER